MSPLLAAPLLLLCLAAIGIVTERRFIPALEIVAERLRMRDDVAGATLLAFGSSAPELFTALVAVLFVPDQASFGIGSVVGSALFQILVVLGFVATLRRTELQWRPVVRDGAVYAIAVVLLFVFARDGRFTGAEAAALLGAYVVHLLLLWFWARVTVDRSPADAGRDVGRDVGLENGGLRGPVRRAVELLPDPRRRPGWTLPVFVVSLGLIGGAAYGLVEAGVALAGALGVAPTIVALTVIAGGTSVPELFASALLARRGKGDMAVANALGSNTFDIFVSLGLPLAIAIALRGPVEDVGRANVMVSVLLLFATLAAVLVLLAVQRFRVGRPFGVALILAYALYVVAAYLGWLG